MFERNAITTPSCVRLDWRLSVGLSLPVYEAPDTPIPVGWALVHQPADQRQKLIVTGLAIGPTPLGAAAHVLDQVRTGDRERVGHRLHGKPSFRSFHDGSCKLGFFTRATSRASLRISTSMVLRPSRRSSSRTRRSSSRTRLVPTTYSSAWTARRPPSSIRRRQLNSKLGATPARRAT